MSEDLNEDEALEHYKHNGNRTVLFHTRLLWHENTKAHRNCSRCYKFKRSKNSILYCKKCDILKKSHPLADIIRPYMKIHPTAKLMHKVIMDVHNWTGLLTEEYLEAYGEEPYTSMLLLGCIHQEEYYNEEYMKGISISLLHQVYGAKVLI